MAVYNLSTDRNFHGLCGFTEAEVQTITEAYLSPSLQAHKVTAAMDQLRQWCSGYNFRKAGHVGQPVDPLYHPKLIFTHLRGLIKGVLVESQIGRAHV